jgi:nicotinate-nucleotide--dimethylbenzimidazole phosphoribosyltransferase
MATERFARPPTRPGFDPSRAAQRAAEPDGWAYPQATRDAIYDVIADRRDIRRFRPDEVPAEVLRRILAAGHAAPSVGLMQPWRFIVVRSLQTRIAVRSLAQRERLRQADRFDRRARQFLDQKIEGVVEAPLGICVCCDHGDPDTEVLGRGSIPETDVYSASCAIQNLWLAARAEGLGIGWVSFYRPPELRALLELPARVAPIAYLCVGWPDERPLRPGLESAGWSSRMALEEVVMDDHWRVIDDAWPAHEPARRPVSEGCPVPDGFAPDRRAGIAARDRSDELVKPAGSLGVLEGVIERWAQVTGDPPPSRIRAGVLVCAADHGHLARGTSLFDAQVSAQVAAAAARGETAVSVLARERDHELLVADLGLAADTPPGVRNCKLARGTADLATESALTEPQLDAALRAGRELVRELADTEVDCLVLGEIGMGNTTTAAALTGALTGAPTDRLVGRGTGVDAAGLERKRRTVELARARNPAVLGGREALCSAGGFELAALVGAIQAAAAERLPVILDGYAVSAAALASVRIDPSLVELLIAGHRSAELGHGLVLTELGLEPLVDLRLRLGEASGALIALTLIESAGLLHREMGTFAGAGVAREGAARATPRGERVRRPRLRPGEEPVQAASGRSPDRG